MEIVKSKGAYFYISWSS
uniref:Uncharacterized protein n=1 Tax=Arundo donax TaxID=35708 RepID=A0A0A9C8M5_ARUDO